MQALKRVSVNFNNSNSNSTYECIEGETAKGLQFIFMQDITNCTFINYIKSKTTEEIKQVTLSLADSNTVDFNFPGLKCGEYECILKIEEDNKILYAYNYNLNITSNFISSAHAVELEEVDFNTKIKDFLLKYSAFNIDVEKNKAAIDTAVKDVNASKLAVENIKKDIETKEADFNTNYTNKSTSFNSNAKKETNTFNTNATNKLNSFNSNAAEKKETIDAAAIDVEKNKAAIETAVKDVNTSKLAVENIKKDIETKEADFNTNYTNKSTSFNSNAKKETNTFNTNATNKLNSFNSNAAEKKETIDTAAIDVIADKAAVENLHKQFLQEKENLNNASYSSTAFSEKNFKFDDLTVDGGCLKNLHLCGNTIKDVATNTLKSVENPRLSCKSKNLLDTKRYYELISELSMDTPTLSEEGVLRYWITDASLDTQNNVVRYLSEEIDSSKTYTIEFEGIAEKGVSGCGFKVFDTLGNYSYAYVSTTNFTKVKKEFSNIRDINIMWSTGQYCQMRNLAIYETSKGDIQPDEMEYKESNLQIADTTIRSIPGTDVKDEIYWFNNKMWLVQNVLKYVFTGDISENWVEHTNYPFKGVYKVGQIIPEKQRGYNTSISDKYPNIPDVHTTSATYVYSDGYNTSGIYINVPSNSLVSADLDGWRNFLATNPMTLLGIAKDPIPVDITDRVSGSLLSYKSGILTQEQEVPAKITFDYLKKNGKRLDILESVVGTNVQTLASLGVQQALIGSLGTITDENLISTVQKIVDIAAGNVKGGE